ncbi:hypothetical protein [uncultured Sphingomonas sp.]|uniref:hypothetical protein n=1 Tax=uncultured Sphingomonas sp. TaxID=158754 RepID=UPI0035CB71CB
MMENPRTTSAREHDDHEMIDAAVAEVTPGQSSSSGGHLAKDVATQAEEAAVHDPEVSRRPEKTDKIDNNAARSGHTGGAE